MTIVGNEPTIPVGELGWSLPANLRWLAEQHGRPDYVPCGSLTGSFLIACADRIESLARGDWPTPRAPGEVREDSPASKVVYLLQCDNAVMAEALRQCRDQFAFYAREHETAGKVEKAATNQRFAQIADGALKVVKHKGDLLRPSARDGECERLTGALTVKADQCDRLAEISRVPACFEYRAKAVAYREAVLMMRAALSADRSDPAGEE